MCTSIVEIVPAKGAGKSQKGWFALSHSVVAYDHPQRAQLEEAVLVDFVNHGEGAGLLFFLKQDEARRRLQFTLGKPTNPFSEKLYLKPKRLYKNFQDY